MASSPQKTKVQKAARHTRQETAAKRGQVQCSVARAANRPIRPGAVSDADTSPVTGPGYEGGIAWDLVDPDSIGVARPIATHTIMAQFQKVEPGRALAVDVDEADLEVFDI